MALNIMFMFIEREILFGWLLLTLCDVGLVTVILYPSGSRLMYYKVGTSM